MTLVEIDKQIEETRNKLFDLREQRSKIFAGEYDWEVNTFTMNIMVICMC